MTEYFELIAQYMNKQNISMHMLAKRSGIDRSTLYQFRRGERMPSREQIIQISHVFTLSPSKQNELIEKWEIACVGSHLYHQRRTMQQLIRDLPVPIDESLSFHLSGQDQLPQQAALSSCSAVLLHIHQLLRHAASIHSDLYLIAQPTEDQLLDALLSSYPHDAGSIHHIICFDSGTEEDETFYNLNCVPGLLKLGIHYPKYFLQYYYDNREVRFSPMTPFPNLVLAKDCAMQISHDFRSALVITDPEQVSLLHTMYDRMRSNTTPLAQQHHVTGLSQLIASGNADAMMLPNLSGNEFFCFKSDIDLLQLLDRPILERNLRTAPENRERALDTLTAFIEQYHAKLEPFKKHFILHPQRLRRFLETGCTDLLPRALYHPFCPADRLLLLQRLLEKLESGQLVLHLCSGDAFMIADHWCIMFFPNNILLLQYVGEDSLHYSLISELVSAAALSDYYSYLLQQAEMRSPAQSRCYIEELLEEYRIRFEADR